MVFKAILFDTQSIQKYIFSGNRLKTNIGASYLVDQVFDLELLPVIRSLVGEKELDDKTWKQVKNPDWTDMPQKARIGYIGGGNALVIFRDEVEDTVLHSVVSQFTKKLLTDVPGLHTGAAIGKLELSADGTMGQANLTSLVHQLKSNQSTEFPVLNVPYTGLTLSCEVNGEAANAYDKDEQRFFSWEVEAKLRADRQTANHPAPAEEELLHKLRSVLPTAEQEKFLEGYTFPMEIGELGQRETEDYIAIVHIDGNNMGAKFAGCKTLTQRKNMSLAIRQQTISAFTELVQEVMAKHYAHYADYLTLKKKEGKAFLPVRPLVLGGDDMTFVCTAKVAFPYARYLMQNLQQKGIYSCGGIAILPSSYPFFLGYEMTEQLCDAAKKKMRALQAQKQTESCWLDFAILHGEQAPTLEQIRAQEYRGALGDMHFGPYRVDADAGKRHSLAALLAGVKLLQTAADRLPMNKVKDLRRVLSRGEHEQQQFLAQLRYLGQAGEHIHLPRVPAWQDYEANLWFNGQTPYVDAIELMDYVVPEEVQD